MKMTFKYFLLLLVINVSVFGQEDKSEPLINLDIFVNGERFHIKDGDTITISNTEIVVRSSDLKTFDFGVLSFDYPKNYSFSFEQDFAYKNWTLDGNDFVIMYFEIGAEIELNMFSNEMVKKFGKKNCKISDIQSKIGKLDLRGNRILIDILGQKLTYDLYEIESDDFKTHFIAFQDTKKEDGSDSDESHETMNVINNSISRK